MADGHQELPMLGLEVLVVAAEHQKVALQCSAEHSQAHLKPRLVGGRATSRERGLVLDPMLAWSTMNTTD